MNVMGLTARDAFISAPTLRQLHDIGIDFTQIIYCNGGNKGEKLKIFLESCKLASTLPDHIVMFDDKLGHLKHVQAVLESFEIDLYGTENLISKVSSRFEGFTFCTINTGFFSFFFCLYCNW